MTILELPVDIHDANLLIFALDLLAEAGCCKEHANQARRLSAQVSLSLVQAANKERKLPQAMKN